MPEKYVKHHSKFLRLINESAKLKDNIYSFNQDEKTDKIIERFNIYNLKEQEELFEKCLKNNLII